MTMPTPIPMGVPDQEAGAGGGLIGDPGGGLTGDPGAGLAPPDSRARGARARFQLYVAADVPLWRLLGGNNRAYGRSVRPMLSVSEAERSCRLAARAAARGTFELSSVGGRAWTWVLIFEDEPVARSDSPYGRRIECRAGAARFRAAAPDAMLTIVRYVPRVLAPTPRVSLSNVARSPLWDNGVHGPLGR